MWAIQQTYTVYKKVQHSTYPVCGSVVHEERRVPVAVERSWPAVDALRTLVKQHLPRLQVYFHCDSIETFNHDGPGLVHVSINMHDGADDMSADVVGVHSQGVSALVDAQAIAAVVEIITRIGYVCIKVVIFLLTH